MCMYRGYVLAAAAKCWYPTYRPLLHVIPSPPCFLSFLSCPITKAMKSKQIGQHNAHCVDMQFY